MIYLKFKIFRRLIFFLDSVSHDQTQLKEIVTNTCIFYSNFDETYQWSSVPKIVWISSIKVFFFRKIISFCWLWPLQQSFVYFTLFKGIPMHDTNRTIQSKYWFCFLFYENVMQLSVMRFKHIKSDKRFSLFEDNSWSSKQGYSKITTTFEWVNRIHYTAHKI